MKFYFLLKILLEIHLYCLKKFSKTVFMCCVKN